MSEFWLGFAGGMVLTGVFGSFILWSLIKSAYHRGKTDGYNQVADVFNPQQFVDEDNDSPAPKKRKTRTMFGDCDDQGRYGGT
jgi:hypothetical protein